MQIWAFLTRISLLSIWFSLRPLIELKGDYFCCCRVCLRAKRSAAHPRLRLNMLEPIFRRRDPTQIIGDMLLANSAYGTSLPSLFGMVGPKIDAHRKIPSL